MTEGGNRAVIEGISKALALQEIRTLGLNIQLAGDEPSTAIETEIKAASNIEITRKDAEVLFVVAFTARASGKGSPSPFLEFACRVLLRYQVRGELPESADLEKHAGVQVMFHAWPFLRSQLQIATGLLGVRPIMLPTMRVTPAGLLQTQPTQAPKKAKKSRTG